MKVVQFNEVLHELYHDNELPPLDFCQTLAAFAEVSHACGRLDEATDTRKQIIQIQRVYLNDDDVELGKSLLCLACSHYNEALMAKRNSNREGNLVILSDNDEIIGDVGDHSSQSSLQEVEKKCRLALRCFQEYTKSNLVFVMMDLSSSLLVQILALQDSQSEAILSTFQSMLSSRKNFFSNVYHLQIAEVYFKMARVNYSNGNVVAAVKQMNKCIRIVRHIYGDCHTIPVSMLGCLASFHLESENVDSSSSISRGENLLSKCIGIKRQLIQEDNCYEQSLSESLQQLENSTRNHQANVPYNQQIATPVSSYQENPSSQEKLNNSIAESVKVEDDKRTVGHTKDDAVMLIALADRIFTKDLNSSKAKKYILKALKILSQCGGEESDDDATASAILKWSSYNKLADICASEDNIQEAAKFYQRALKGFLSINTDIQPAHRDTKAEAITIAFNLASLVHHSMDFITAVPLYLKVVEILSQINTVIVDFDCGNTTTTDPPYSKVEHATTLDHIVNIFEANVSAEAPDPIAHMSSTIMGAGASTPLNTPSFILRVRTLAMTVFVHHLGLEDERAVQCRDKLDQINVLDKVLKDVNIHDFNDFEVDVSFDGGKNEEKADGKLLPSDLTTGDETSNQCYVDMTSADAATYSTLSDNVAKQQVSEVKDVVAPQEAGKKRATNKQQQEHPQQLQEPQHRHQQQQQQAEVTKPDEVVNESEKRNQEKLIYVFAFGCCRRNQLYSNILSGRGDCSYLGTTSTTEKFYMFISKYDGKPFITTQPLPSDYAGVSKGVSCAIIGEVYSVPSTVLPLVNEDICHVKSSIVKVAVKSLKDMKGSDGDNVYINLSDVNSLTERFTSNCRNIPRGNYTEFIRARGGIEAFIENSKCSLK